MNTYDEKLQEILLRENYISAEDMDRSLAYAAEGKRSLTDALLAQQVITPDLLGQAIAEFFGVSYADLNSAQLTKEMVLTIPEELAQQYRVVLFAEEDAHVTVTTDNPAQKDLAQVLATLFPKKAITIAYSLSDDIDSAFTNYKKPLDTRFSQIIKGQKRIAPELLEEIFTDALLFHASDIHFEPQTTEVLVRFRIDGVLQEAGRLKHKHYENILNRIKVQSHLRIDEHYAAQDGSMRYEQEGTVFDLRTSIVPTVEGEKVVLRVLASYIKGLNLEALGLSPENQALLTEASHKPFGMILVIGPTGSGKTTTLYGVLKTLNTPEVNITTIEDPVEYKVKGVTQIQVNKDTNLTFAQGLRSVVRQDPDIILVGEIRDEETAEIAVNAALTGHLLLSTFHANDAATAIPRLLDMHAEPFLLASTLEIIVAQRLVRTLCQSCRYSTTVAPKDLEKHRPGLSTFFDKKSLTLYAGKGCDACGHTGYKGRSALFEIIRVTPELEALILQQPSAQQIWELARSQGSRLLFEDGIDKVKSGMTSLEELLRVAEPPAQ